MKIILISGKMGSGKTTVSEGLTELLKKNRHTVSRLKFADPLYAMHDAVGVAASKYGIPFDKKEGVLLQLLGTEWGRQIKGDSVWVDSMKYRVSQTSCDFVIIDDCRFKNEFNAFEDAFKLRLKASEEIRKNRADSWRPNTTHLSEIDLDDFEINGRFDLVVDTNLNDKQKTLDLIMTTIQKRP